MMSLTITRKRLPLFSNDFYGDMDRFFQSFFESSESSDKAVVDFRPDWDVTETESDYQLHVELPGLEREGIEIEVVDESLVIRGEKNLERKSDDKKFHRVERSNGRFERMIQFPTQVDFERVNAQLEHGVLNITVPKAEAAVPRKIEVQ